MYVTRPRVRAASLNYENPHLLLISLNSRHSLQNKDGTSHKISVASNGQSRMITSLRMQDLSVHSMNKVRFINCAYEGWSDIP
jgi:hypothetical protein